MAKALLRRDAWRVADPVWWRPDPREGRFVPFEASDREQWEQQFAASGRAALLPASA